MLQKQGIRIRFIGMAKGRGKGTTTIKFLVPAYGMIVAIFATAIAAFINGKYNV